LAAEMPVSLVVRAKTWVGRRPEAATLVEQHLLDVVDPSIHPVLAGSVLVATKSYANIVRLIYEPQYA
jgi:hypothetical protein